MTLQEQATRIDNLLKLAKRAGIVAKLTTQCMRWHRVQVPACILKEMEKYTYGTKNAAMRSFNVGFAEGHRYTK